MLFFLCFSYAFLPWPQIIKQFFNCISEGKRCLKSSSSVVWIRSFLLIVFGCPFWIWYLFLEGVVKGSGFSGVETSSSVLTLEESLLSSISLYKTLCITFIWCHMVLRENEQIFRREIWHQIWHYNYLYGWKPFIKKYAWLGTFLRTIMIDWESVFLKPQPLSHMQGGCCMHGLRICTPSLSQKSSIPNPASFLQQVKRVKPLPCFYQSHILWGMIISAGVDWKGFCSMCYVQNWLPTDISQPQLLV